MQQVLKSIPATAWRGARAGARERTPARCSAVGARARVEDAICRQNSLDGGLKVGSNIHKYIRSVGSAGGRHPRTYTHAHVDSRRLQVPETAAHLSEPPAPPAMPECLTSLHDVIPLCSRNRYPPPSRAGWASGSAPVRECDQCVYAAQACATGVRRFGSTISAGAATCTSVPRRAHTITNAAGLDWEVLPCMVRRDCCVSGLFIRCMGSRSHDASQPQPSSPAACPRVPSFRPPIAAAHGAPFARLSKAQVTAVTALPHAFILLATRPSLNGVVLMPAPLRIFSSSSLNGLLGSARTTAARGHVAWARWPRPCLRSRRKAGQGARASTVLAYWRAGPGTCHHRDARRRGYSMRNRELSRDAQENLRVSNWPCARPLDGNGGSVVSTVVTGTLHHLTSCWLDHTI